jgi:hypothetical protein
MKPRTFFAELHRRDVEKVAVAYAVGGLAGDPGSDLDFSGSRDSQLAINW